MNVIPSFAELVHNAGMRLASASKVQGQYRKYSLVDRLGVKFNNCGFDGRLEPNRRL